MRRKGLVFLLILTMLMSLSACNAAGPEESSTLPVETKTTEAKTETGSAEQTTAALSTEALTTETPTEASTAEAPGIDFAAIEFQPVEYYLGTWYDREIACFGPNGEKVTIPGQPVKDVFTGETRYYMVSCSDVIQDLNLEEEGAYYRLLFEPDGTLVEQDVRSGINGALGELLIRDDYSEGCGLWDCQQKKYEVENISNLYRLDEKTALAIDGNGCVRGLLDRETLTVTEVKFEKPLNVQWFCEGLIFTNELGEGDPILVILNDRLEPVYRSGREGYCVEDGVFDLGEDGKFFCVNDLEGARIIRVKGDQTQIIYENKEDTTFGMYLLHCDHHRMVIQDRGESFLCDLEGNRLTESYEQMGCLVPEDGSGSGRFAAVKERTIYILDKDGKILDQKKISGLQEVCFLGGAINYITRGGSDAGSTAYSDSGYAVGLMDADFNDMIEPVRLGYIDLYQIGDGPDHIWVVTREVQGGDQHDIYNSDMKPISKGAAMVGTVTERGVAIQKGFSRGVIDFDGNWIAEYSIYEDEWRD